MLWLALRFPHLPMEALGYSFDDNQSIVIEHQHRIYDVSHGASSAGIQQGMKASAVHALTETTVLERQPEHEGQALQRLAAWAYSYTPYIQRYEDNCLLLEVSRCLRLFGGIEALCDKLKESLDNRPHKYQLGLAHSRHGAWLLSHSVHKPHEAHKTSAQHIISEDDSQHSFMSRISEMPLDYLHAFPQIRDDLQTIGLNTFGDILQLPSHELNKRFGEQFGHWLKDLRGEQAEALPLHQPEENFCASISFNHPVSETKMLEIPAEHLLQEFVDYLVKNQQEAQQIDWYFYSPQGQVHSISLGTERIHNQWQLLLDLTRIRLEQLQLYFEIERLELRCNQTTAVESKTTQLFEQMDAFADGVVQENAESMISRLQARMGTQSVHQLSERAEHLPEKQGARVLPFSGKASLCKDQIAITKAPRPCWLFQKPRQINRKGNNLFWKGALQLVQGPERIEGNWWERPSVRDYFIAEREDQIRYWVYHDWTDDSWHAQGIFA